MLNNLLIYRFIIFNILILVGIAAAGQQGWLVAFVESDKSHISLAIITIFLGAWAYQAYKANVISKRINAFKHAVGTKHTKGSTWLDPYRDSIRPVSVLVIIRDKDLTKIEWMFAIAKWLVVIGLIGTIVGFIIGLSGVSQSELSGEQDIEGIKNSIVTIITGMHVALYTTLAGAVAGLIIELNAKMMHTALYNHWADIIKELGK